VRTLIAWTLTLAIASSAWAQGNAPAVKKANPPANPKAAAPLDPAAEKARLEAEAANRAEMEKVLVEWENRSKRISSLDVLFDRVDVSPGWGNHHYQGRAMLQSPDLACLQFQKYKLDANGKRVFVNGKDGKPVAQMEPEPFERIVCTGKEVLQYSWDDHKIFIFPLDKQARQKALQQGPLPFLFNMKAAECKKRYSMTLLKQNETDYLIGILPREEIDKDSFSQAFLWLSKKTYLPNQLWLYTNGEKERQEFKFAGDSNKIVANSPLNANFFLANRFEGWKVIDNPNANGAPPAQGKAVVAPGQPPRRPANPAAANPGGRTQ
jgi:TIGR03009 family protein